MNEYIFIYTTKKIVKDNLFYLFISNKENLLKIFNNNVKLDPYIYLEIPYTLENINKNVFLSFLSLTLNDYILENKKKNFTYNEFVKIDPTKLHNIIIKLIENFNKINFNSNHNIGNIKEQFIFFLNNEIIIDFGKNKILTTYNIKKKFLDNNNIIKNDELNKELNYIINNWIQNNNLITKQYTQKTYIIKYVHNVYFKN